MSSVFRATDQSPARGALLTANRAPATAARSDGLSLPAADERRGNLGQDLSRPSQRSLVMSDTPQLLLRPSSQGAQAADVLAQGLVGVPRSHTRASLIAARVIDDADPEHDAVIDTVRGRQCAVLNFPAQNSSFLRGGSYSAVIWAGSRARRWIGPHCNGSWAFRAAIRGLRSSRRAPSSTMPTPNM